MSWITPKTDWVSTDHFNIVDYNRIKNNLNYLHEQSQLIWGEYDISDMGSDITSNEVRWQASRFNQFEANLDTINQHMLNRDIGIRQTFYDNGIFIKYSELNRIENATLLMKTIIDGWYEAMATLPFVLGNKKGVKS